MRNRETEIVNRIFHRLHSLIREEANGWELPRESDGNLREGLLGMLVNWAENEPPESTEGLFNAFAYSIDRAAEFDFSRSKLKK